MSNPYDQNPQSQPGSNPYQPPPGQYPVGGTPAPYGQSYGAPAQEHPQGTMIFVLGIVGIFVGVCAPIAWYLGNKTLREIAASGASYGNVSQIRTGRMLGKVFTIIYIVFIVLYIIALIVIFGVAASQGNI